MLCDATAVVSTVSMIFSSRLGLFMLANPKPETPKGVAGLAPTATVVEFRSRL